jgi:hypothetical protein
VTTGQSPQVRKSADQVREDLASEGREVDNSTRRAPRRFRIPLLLPPKKQVRP